jgi:hypothetical protein
MTPLIYSLVGRLLPTQVTGKDDTPLIPERAADPDENCSGPAETRETADLRLQRSPVPRILAAMNSVFSRFRPRFFYIGPPAG